MSKRVYVLDGKKFSTLDEFARTFSDVVLEDYQWRGDFNVFNDVLRGGFGTPLGGFVLRWENSALSRERLGYAETAKLLEEQMRGCHPSTLTYLQHKLEEARQCRGEIIFDIIIEIIQVHCVGGEEAIDGVELELL